MDEIRQLLENPEFRGAAQLASLVFARILPIIAFSPVFGGQVIPRRLRVGISILLAIVLFPTIYTNTHQAIAAAPYVVLLVKEAIVGLTLTFFLVILFETIAAVGALVDLARGATLANVFDPVTQNQQSILAQFFTQLAIVLFLSIGGIQFLIRALADSFVLLRPDQILPDRLVGAAGTTEAIGLLGDMFLLVFRLGAPAVLVLLLLDFALGVINRVSPQIQVYFLGMTVKGVIGLLVVLLGFSLFGDQIIDQFARILQAMRDWVTLAR
jgi:flagellar biosynthetic protein FliR